jgi:TolA-binding protein
MSRFRFLILLLLVLAACQIRPVTLMQEAETLYLKNQYRESVRIFLEIVDRYPGSKDAQLAMLRVGQTFMLNLNNPQSALEYFSRLVTEYPNGQQVVPAREAMANIYEKNMRDYDKAIEQYRFLLAGDYITEPEKYILAIGRCFYLKEDYSQAINEYHSISEKYPNSKFLAEAEYQIANCFFVWNKCDDATRQYNMVLTKFPTVKYRNDILLSLAVCMEDREEYSSAIKIYRELEEKYENKALIKKKIESATARMRNKRNR